MKQRLTGNTLEHYRVRYQRAKIAKKQAILDHVCELYGYHRKSAIRLLKGIERDTYGKPRPGRPHLYEDPELLKVLQTIWIATDYMGSKRLKSALKHWLPHYESSYSTVSATIKKQLLKISASSIDRALNPIRLQSKRRGLSGTRPGSLLKNQIPLKTDHWDITKPGFLEADTVAHCGNSMAGDFVWSLTATDIYSGWTENRATWNKGAHGVLEQIQSIEAALPFALLGLDCDNGSEFLNYHLLRYLTARTNVVQFTRSRPYKKDDNAHVEQKNWTHVRQLFGYDRFDHQPMVELMNDLYANEWSLLQNYFYPNTKLISKIKINSRYKKHYDKPKTPYQRLMESQEISEHEKERLKAVYLSLNPFELKQRIEQKLKVIFKWVDVKNRSKNRAQI